LKNKILYFLLLFCALFGSAYLIFTPKTCPKESQFAFYTPPVDTKPYPLLGKSQVKNIILMIGDGMGGAQVASARIRALGADKKLYMEKMPVTGLVNTYAANNLVTDSAAAATALASGYKTNNGMIGVTPDGKSVVSILEALKSEGFAVGLVATSSITHATPAAFASHVMLRKYEDKIAPQLVENRVNVILGGGREFFLPKSEKASKRYDNRNVIDEAKKAGYSFVQTRNSLINANAKYLLGLFQDGALKTKSPEPTLSEMTTKAIEILEREQKGFFLMVEGSQIDWACHNHDINGSIRQTLLFDETVHTAVKFAKRDGHTLVVVTADHETGGMTINAGTVDGQKLSIAWGTPDHTAVPVSIYAFGAGAEKFMGLHDNTEIPKIFARLLDVKGFHDSSSRHVSVLNAIYNSVYATAVKYLKKG